jgi:Tol biopolymer transport system component
MQEAWDASEFAVTSPEPLFVDERVAIVLGDTRDRAYLVGTLSKPPPRAELVPPFELHLRTAAGEDVLVTSFDERIDYPPTASSDGQFLAVGYYDDQRRSGFYIVDLQQRRKTLRVTNAQEGEWLDAQRLHYTSDACGGGQPPVIDGTPAPFVEAPNIDMLDAASGIVTHLAATDRVEQHGVASPDGRTIAYVVRDLAWNPTGDEIALVDVATGETRTLVRGVGLLLTNVTGVPPKTWSLDGRYLTFDAAGDGYMHGLCQDVWPASTTVERLP